MAGRVSRPSCSAVPLPWHCGVVIDVTAGQGLPQCTEYRPGGTTLVTPPGKLAGCGIKTIPVSLIGPGIATEKVREDIAKNRAESFGQCKCLEGFQVNDRKAAAPSLYISQVSLTLTDLSDACVQTDNCHPHQTSVLTQVDFKNGDETRNQFDACVQVSNDANVVDACVQTAIGLSRPSLDHPTRPPDVISLRHQTDSWAQTDSWDSQGHGETADTVCACTQTFYGCSDASTQTDGQSRHSVSTVHSYVSALVANAVAEIGAEAQSCYNLDAQGQQFSEGHCSQQDIEKCQNQGECREKQTSKQDEKQETCLDLPVNQQDQIQEEIYCKQNVPELSQGQDILQDKGQDKTPCCGKTEIGTVSEKNCEDKVFECHSVDQDKLVNDSIEAKVLPPKTQLTSDTLEETMDHVLTPNVSTVTQVTENCSDVPVSQTHNTEATLDYTEDGSYNISSNSVASAESSLGQVATPDTANSKVQQEKDSELVQDTSPAAKSQGKMSYLYDPVLDIYYRPSEGVQPDDNDPNANSGNDHTETTTSSDTRNLAPGPLGTGSAGPSLSGFSSGSQGFRPPDSSSLISKLPEANSYRLGFSPPDSRPLDTKTSSLDSKPAEGNPGSLGCRTSLQERLGLMSKIRMANSFSIQEEEAEDGCEEDTELFPGVGRGPLPVLREESMEMSSDTEENHFIPVVHEPSSEKSPASSEDEEGPLDLPRRGSLLQPRDDSPALRSKSAEFSGDISSQTPPGLDSPVAVIYTSGRRALAAGKTSSGFQGRRGSSGFLTRPKVHRRSDPIKKASLQELRKISFCRGSRPILSFSEEGVVDLLHGSLEEVELTEEDRKRNLELLEECRIASERFKNRPRPYKFKKAGKTHERADRPASPARQETAEESVQLHRFGHRREGGHSPWSQLNFPADQACSGRGVPGLPHQTGRQGAGYKDFPLPKAQGGYRDFPLVKTSGGPGGYQDFPLKPIPGLPGDTPTPPQKQLREQGRGAEENKVRFGNTAAVSSRLPELAEASETESKQDHAEGVSRSMPESVLRNLGLATSQPQRCLTEEEVENRFTALALEWRTDSYTLEKRCLLLERQRDVAEKNLDQEMSMLRGSLVGLNHLVKDRETHELMRELHQQMDIIHHLNIKVSIKSEMHGSVQQEWRVSRAIEVMMQHVENLKRLYEREHAELEEMRRLIQDTGVFDRFAIPTRTSESGEDSPTTGPIRVRRASIALSPGMNKGMRRRASVAAIPRSIAVGLGGPPSPDAAGGNRRPPMVSRGSVFGPNGTSAQGSSSVDDTAAGDKSKTSAVVKEAVRRFSVGRLMELAMVTKRPDKKNSVGEKTDKLDKEKEEEIFQKGWVHDVGFTAY
ncbi:mrvi1 protein [Branchiostoma belcheri]|nr:mrvi1 protein [Branchiostoma belcheri]